MSTETTNPAEAIESLEREIAAKREEINKLRRQMPKEYVEDYTLKNADGQPVRLSELFGDKRDLLVIHNMGKHCPYCTLWADGFNGLLPHIENRTATVMVSSDSPDVQQEFARSRDWNFKMYSNEDSNFTQAMGYIFDQDGQTYLLPGASAFRLEDDGRISRSGKAMFGPGDSYCGVWHFFDLLAEGANNWQPQYQY